MSGMIIFWMLIVLIDECMNQQITYPDRQVIKARTKTARIQCKVGGSTPHWYRAQSGKALERIMYFDAGTPKYETSFKNRFSGTKSGNLVTLTISALTADDAGMYYCAVWSSDNHSVNTERKSLQKPVDIIKDRHVALYTVIHTKCLKIYISGYLCNINAHYITL